MYGDWNEYSKIYWFFELRLVQEFTGRIYFATWPPSAIIKASINRKPLHKTAKFPDGYRFRKNNKRKRKHDHSQRQNERTVIL